MKVPFHDVDPMQIVWYGNYMKYFDIARQGLFESQGIDLQDVLDKTGYAFPVVRSSVKHIRPLHHLDVFFCIATLVEVTHKVVIDFEIRLETDNTLCAKGRGEQAAVKYPEMEIAFEIPEIVRTRLASTQE
jgi:acyl-CoA thioester hydrolase